MALDRLKASTKKIVGTKETEKHLLRGDVQCVYVAKDADERVVRQVVKLATEAGVEVVWAESMRELGRACGIEVGAATAAVPRA